MTRDEFNVLMDSLGVLICDGERRIKGFVIEFRQQDYQPNYVTIKGKIPLPLANKISSNLEDKLGICVEGDTEETLPIQYAKHFTLEEYYKRWDVKNFNEKKAQLIADGRENEMYIEKYHVQTIEGMKHVVNCIREYN